MIETPKEVKVPNGKNSYKEISRKLNEVAGMPRISRQIIGVETTNHWWDSKNLVNHNKSI